MIYFIEAPEVGMIKIGFTSGSPDRRLKHLRIGSPVDLFGLAHMPGSLDREGRLHARFARYRVRGEWFRDCRPIRRYIARKAEEWIEADAPREPEQMRRAKLARQQEEEWNELWAYVEGTGREPEVVEAYAAFLDAKKSSGGRGDVPKPTPDPVPEPAARKRGRPRKVPATLSGPESVPPDPADGPTWVYDPDYGQEILREPKNSFCLKELRRKLEEPNP